MARSNRPRTVHGEHVTRQIEWLERAVGSQEILARKAEVSDRTVRNWKESGTGAFTALSRVHEYALAHVPGYPEDAGAPPLIDSPDVPGPPEPDGPGHHEVPHPPDGPDEEGAGRPRWHRWATSALVVLVVAVVVHLLTSLVRDDPQVRITAPAADADIPVEVTARGTSDVEDVSLWIDVRARDEPRHHPTEQPLTVHADGTWSVTLYVGRDGGADVGRPFTIDVLAVPSGSAAERALVRYGERDTGAPGAYDGLETLPAGTRVMATVDVTRG